MSSMKRTAIDDYRGPTVIGVDVSAYQGGDIDWPAVARAEAIFDGGPVGPVRYAIIRSSDGVQTRRRSKPDPMAVRNLQEAHKAGLLVAVYHFVRAYHGADAQLEIVLDVIRTAGVPVAFIAWDVEGRPDDPKTPDTDESSGAWWAPPSGANMRVPSSEVLSDLVELQRGAASAGHRSIIYSGVAWHWYVAQRGIEVPPEIAGLELWTPYYSTSKIPKMPVGPNGEPWPWAEWRFWQFAGSKKLPGRVNGIPGIVDLNRFHGDEEELEKWWIPTTLPPPSPEFVRYEIIELAQKALDLGDRKASSELQCAFKRLTES